MRLPTKWKKGFKVMWGTIGIIVLLCFPFIESDPYILHMLIMSGIFALHTMGWVLILRVGQFSLGQAGFYAVGAYFSALMVKEQGLSFWIALPFSGIISATVALMIGSVVLRIRGLYFAIITFAFAEIIRLIIISRPETLGGLNGITGIPKPPPIDMGIIRIDFVASRITFYYLMLLLVTFAAFVFWRMDASRIGRIFRSISMNDSLAESVGIHLMKFKVLAFSVACFFSGISGSFFAHYYGVLHPDSFTVWESILIQMKATVGGTASAVGGPILGAATLTIISEFLRSTKNLEPLLYGAILMVILFILPGGLVSLGPRISEAIKRKGKG